MNKKLCLLLAVVAASVSILAHHGSAQSTDESKENRDPEGLVEGGLRNLAWQIIEETSGEGCTCPNPFSYDREVGIIWRGEEPITLERIANIAAPVMWFSLDEPLIMAGEGPLPNPHPCDDGVPEGRAAVYYQARVLRVVDSNNPVTLPAHTDPDFFNKVHSFILRYYFYYVRDKGVGEHSHDVEVAEFHMANERTADGCYQVRLKKVIAMAHGVDWYNNIMEMRDDTRLPIHLFVEEGKHASCPDRNADGIYTPGYDVTKRVNDAWGVRDVLGQGVLAGASYKAAMAKRRDWSLRMLPPEDPDRCPSLPYRAQLREEFLGRYVLRPGAEIEMCDEVENHPEVLMSMMERHGLGRDEEPEQYEEDSIKDISSKIENPASILPSVSLRYDDRLGVSFILNGLDMGEFWIVPRINLSGRVLGLDLLGTSSASRWADWYVSFGSDYYWAEKEKVDGEKVTVREGDWNIAIEGGYKFRFRAPGKIRPALLGYQFGGLRFGVRTNGFDTLGQTRFIVELGAGVW